MITWFGYEIEMLLEKNKVDSKYREEFINNEKSEVECTKTEPIGKIIKLKQAERKKKHAFLRRA